MSGLIRNCNYCEKISVAVCSDHGSQPLYFCQLHYQRHISNAHPERAVCCGTHRWEDSDLYLCRRAEEQMGSFVTKTHAHPAMPVQVCGVCGIVRVKPKE